MAELLQFEGYIVRDNTVLLRDRRQELRIGIGELVNRDDLISRLSPEDALRIGSWHGSYVSNKWRLIQAEVRAGSAT